MEEQPIKPGQAVFKTDFNQSLHYPFTNNQDNIVGNMEDALARIQQVKSGRIHVTGTLPPKINVSPDPGSEVTMQEPTQNTQEPPTVAVPTLVTQEPPAVAAPVTKSDKPSDADLEAFRKQRKKERRLARKAKKAGEAGKAETDSDGDSDEEVPVAPEAPVKQFKHDWHKKNLVTNADMSDSYECTKCHQKYKRQGLNWGAPEFGCTKE